ncbi:hypothetical protein, partial [Salmonella sp. s55962]|uniref:hypothetical protein n=1 Tax=Salmonella sp. s55962 TaxID=3159685 RepID=UPI00397FCA14
MAPILGVATVFGAIYSLLIFQKTKTKTKVLTTLKFKPIEPREHLLIFFHLIPLLPIIINP